MRDLLSDLNNYVQPTN